jgi:hypothetical protein
MSNFLQRVAATVIQPKANLQPMLGSIFAPATFYSPAEPFTPEISMQTVAPRRHEPTRFDGFNQAFTRHAFETADRLFPATPQEDFSSAHSNRSPTADQPFLPAFSNTTDPRDSTNAHPSVEDSAFESLKPAANQTASSDAYQPLIAATHLPPPRLQPMDSLSNPAAARTSASEAARRFQPAQREADEIHIHIGRIEVAAIAQPVPRPAAAAARRSLNLDEYLRRGNGRPG